MRKKVAIVTATRAEYGLLKPLIKKIELDDTLELELIVTGTHLSEKYGNTMNEILEDNVPIAHKISILEEGNLAKDISQTMANAITKFSICFLEEKPDLLIILGDRTEMLGVAIAAMNERIPIAHIAGGEVTEGAVDDCIRHALTKMSCLHFAATELYRKRIIQLGENPNRVFNVGAPGIENILNAPMLSEEEIRQVLGIDDNPYAMVTFHPVTLESHESKLQQIRELCKAMELVECNFVITSANADAGGEIINDYLFEFAKKHNNRIKMFHSLGVKNYLSAVKYASFMLGNSSSGIAEGPALGTPTVNIGDRQKGRLMAETVINCQPYCNEIVNAIDIAMKMEHRKTTMFGDGTTSEKILKVIKEFLNDDKLELKKQFYDVEF